MKIGEWNAGINSRDYARSVDILLWRDIGGGLTEVLGPDFVIRTVGESEAYDGPPTVRLGKDMLQGLADALYKHGIHPQERRFNEEMGLVKAHLKDMRRLVFKGK